MFDTLFNNKFPQYIYIAPGVCILRKYIVVRDDNNPLTIPHLSVIAEFSFEYLYSSRAADIMGHKDIHINPYIVTRSHMPFPGMSPQYLFCQCHAHNRKFKYQIS